LIVVFKAGDREVVEEPADQKEQDARVDKHHPALGHCGAEFQVGVVVQHLLRAWQQHKPNEYRATDGDDCGKDMGPPHDQRQ